MMRREAWRGRQKTSYASQIIKNARVGSYKQTQGQKYTRKRFFERKFIIVQSAD